MVSWCSWLSHVSNTHKVPRSSLGEIIRSLLLLVAPVFFAADEDALIVWLRFCVRGLTILAGQI
jgi:hypothetical protein